MPNRKQHVIRPTRDDNTLDQVKAGYLLRHFTWPLFLGKLTSYFFFLIAAFSIAYTL